MARLTFQRVLGVLLAALLAGCLGGQTGQPDSAVSQDCEASTVSAQAGWSGTSVYAAASAFEGTYSFELLWQTGRRGSADHTPVELDDSAQLVIEYPGDDGLVDSCVSTLSVPVSVSFTTSASGVTDSGNGTLLISSTSSTQPGLLGSLRYHGKLVDLFASLPERVSGGTASGDLDALDPTLPGGSALLPTHEIP